MKKIPLLHFVLALACLLAAPLLADFDLKADNASKLLRWEHGLQDGWKLENGRLEMTPDPADGLRIGIAGDCTPAAGYRIRARVSFPNPKAGGHAGFQVRRASGKACYVHLAPGGTYLGVTGLGDKLQEKRFSASPDGTHLLEIDVLPTGLKVSVDGKEYITGEGLVGDASGAAFMAFKAPVVFTDVTIGPLEEENTAVAPPEVALFDLAGNDTKKQLRWEHGLQDGWKLENGRLALTPDPADGLRIGLTDDCTPAEGYRITARMSFPNPKAGGQAGFLVRRTCGKACYVHLAPGGTYLGVTGLGDKLQEKTIPAAQDGTHLLQIDVLPTALKVSVDGKEYITGEGLVGDASGAAFMAHKTPVVFSETTITPLKQEVPFVPPKTTRRGFMVSELTPEIVHDIKETWHANIVRLQLIPLFWAPKKGITHAEAWKWMMEQLPGWLDNARDAGILVVIDLHNVPRPFPVTSDSKDSLDRFWKDLSYRQLFLDCWNDIAHICKDRPEEIWFDLMNEPLNWKDMPSFPKAWPDWAQAAIDVIRVTDKRHAIVVEPGPGGLCWGFREFQPLRDPCDNIIYSTHQYQPHIYTMQGIRDITGTDLSQAYLERGLHWPGNFDDSGGGWWDIKRIEEQEMACVIEFQRKYKARIFIGEFSVCRWAPEGATYLDECIALFEKYGWDWTYHAFRESRIWSLEHENSFTSEPKLSETPNDRAQVVHKYMNQNAAQK